MRRNRRRRGWGDRAIIAGAATLGIGLTALASISVAGSAGELPRAIVRGLPWIVFVAGSSATLAVMLLAAWSRAERRRREREHQDRLASAQRFREVVQHMAGAVFVLTPDEQTNDFVVREANEAAAGFAGVAREALVGGKLNALFPAAAGTPAMAALRRVAASGELERVPPFFYCDARRAWWAECSVFRLGSGEIVLAAVDLTAQKQVEQELRAARDELEVALEASHVGLWSWSMETNLVHLDGRAAEMFGFGPAAAREAAPEALLAQLNPGDRDATRARLQQAIEARQPVEAEFRVHRADGSFGWVCTRARPLFDREGRLVEMLGCIWDVTDRRRMQEHLQRVQRIESLGTLAGGVAHDLNNALSPVAMGLDLLRRREGMDAVARETIQTMAECVSRAAAVVAQLGAFTHGGSARPALTPAQRVLDALRATLMEGFPKQIEVRVERAPDDLPLLALQESQIHQVLLNLCLNGRDAMPQGGRLGVVTYARNIGDVEMREFPELTPGRYVVFEVADSGPGIPAAIRERIFDPFFTTKEVGRGSGLGLSTALGIVRAHRGAIRFETSEGAGTVFLVLLPAAEPAAPAAPAPGFAVAESSGAGRCVLIVEDESSVRELARRALEMEGYRVFTAVDGKDGVAVFARHPDDIDVVIMDLLMPVMSGALAATAIRRIRPDVPIIAASGFAAEPVMDEARRVGLTSFLAKPFSLEALTGAVRAAVEGHSRPRGGS